MAKLKLSKGYSSRGADMGRRNIWPADRQAPAKLRMQRLKWQDGDYDEGGAYWGRTFVTRPSESHSIRHSYNVYCAWNEEEGDNEVQIFVRAVSREEAKERVRQDLHKATFYR